MTGINAAAGTAATARSASHEHSNVVHSPSTPSSKRPTHAPAPATPSSKSTPRRIHRTRGALPQKPPLHRLQAPRGASSRLTILAVLVLGTGVRWALFRYTSAPTLLGDRVEVSTPVSSYKSVQETLHLALLSSSHPSSHHPRPYASSTSYVSPLLIPLSRLLLEHSHALWIALDVASCVSLYSAWSSLTRPPHSSGGGGGSPSATTRPAPRPTRSKKLGEHPEEPNDDDGDDGPGAAGGFVDSAARTLAEAATSPSAARVLAIHYLNPLSVAACVGRDLGVLVNALVLAAAAGALRGSILQLGLSLALASLLALHPILYAPALLLLSAQVAVRRHYHHQQNSNAHRRRGPTSPPGISALVAPLLVRGATLGALLATGTWMSFVLAGRDLRFLDRVYGTVLLLRDLQPNVGLWWYFFIEMFDHFRAFFLLAFNVHLGVYALPFAIKYGAARLGRGGAEVGGMGGDAGGESLFDEVKGVGRARGGTSKTERGVDTPKDGEDSDEAAVVTAATPTTTTTTLESGEDALFALTATTGVAAVFRSYPTLGDTALFWTLLYGLHARLVPYMRYTSITASLYAYSLALLPTLHRLWLVVGSGNANFFYATTLVWALAGGGLVLDAMWAWGRRRWEEERRVGLAPSSTAAAAAAAGRRLREVGRSGTESAEGHEPPKARRTRVVVQA